MAPDLAYVISHGFAARMILHSTLLDHLSALGLKVAPYPTDKPFRWATGRRRTLRLSPLGPKV